MVQRRRLSESTWLVNSLNVFGSLRRVAFCTMAIESGFHMWYSPLWRHWYCPPTCRADSPATSCSGYAVACRLADSASISSSPIPPMREGVQVKYRSMRLWLSPTASKICAPR